MSKNLKIVKKDIKEKKEKDDIKTYKIVSFFVNVVSFVIVIVIGAISYV